MKICTLDIETNALENPTVIHCAALKDHDNGRVTTYDPDTIHQLPGCLSNYDCICGHNIIAFDEPTIRRVLGYSFKGKLVDTLLISRVQCPNRKGGHSVANWGRILGRRKVEHEEWDKYSEAMLHRCVEDVEIQYCIHEALLAERPPVGTWELCHRLNSELFRCLQRQHEYGWSIDQAQIHKCTSFLTRWMVRIDKAITPKLPKMVENLGTVNKPFLKTGAYSEQTIRYYGNEQSIVSGPFTRILIRSLSLNAPSELKGYLLSLGWQPLEWNKGKDGKRTSPKLSKDDDFIGVQGSLGRLITRYVQCKQRLGIIEGWINHLDTDGRLRGKVSDFAATGRIRHSIIVNVPNPETKSFFSGWMRKCFSTSPGMIMVGVDSKGNQLRQLAARMDDDDFTRSVLHGSKDDGSDLHSLNQRRAKCNTRTTAKNFFYGVIFGASNKKLSKYGRATRESFFAELPKLGQLVTKLSEEWKVTAEKHWNSRWNKWEYRNGYIVGLDERPILVDSEHKLLNYVLMSDEAIQMAAAYVWFHKQMEKQGYEYGKDWGMLLWYHDEFQFECRPEIAEDCAKFAERSISWAGEFYKIKCPHEGQAQIGYNWSETH